MSISQEVWTYASQMHLGEVPRIQHFYKHGFVGYYEPLACGKCAKPDAVQFEAALLKRIINR
tara:strand:+ start:34559 stop:34744 length:186 start_codon:yes stop_codon:yes gene_type:complete